MVVVTPANFTVTGSGFTPGASITFSLLQSGTVVNTWTVQADGSSIAATSSGSLNVSLDSSGILALASFNGASYVPGSYTGTFYATDPVYGNTNAITMTVDITTVAPSISIATTGFTFSE